MASQILGTGPAFAQAPARQAEAHPSITKTCSRSLFPASRVIAGDTAASTSARSRFGEELAYGFEPIRVGVTRQRESAAAF